MMGFRERFDGDGDVYEHVRQSEKLVWSLRDEMKFFWVLQFAAEEIDLLRIVQTELNQ